MALYVVNVPNPQVGQDWQTVVPGQYLYDVTSVTAELVVRDTTSPMHDSSGNLFTGTYHYSTPGLLAVPGVTPGADSVLFETVTGTSRGFCGQSPTAMPKSGGANPRTVEGWYIGLDVNGLDIPLIVTEAPAFLTRIIVLADGSIQFDANSNTGPQTITAPAGTAAFDGIAHHVAGVAGLAGMDLYYDGANVASAVGARSGGGNNLGVRIGNNVPGPFQAQAHIIGQVALYPSALSALRIAAHYAAGLTSAAAFAVEVLADAPRAYYVMDDALGEGEITPNLVVTDGSLEVIRIPPTINLLNTGTVLYSWQTKLNSQTAAPDGQVLTMGLPDLVLPAGYTIGTVTPDLSTTSIWRNISVWWNSALQDALNPPNPYDYPPGARLRPMGPSQAH